MTEDNFKSGMKKLTAAFNRELPDKTIKIYWEYLIQISDKKWLASIEEIIEHEDRFPSIAELKRRGRPLEVAL